VSKYKKLLEEAAKLTEFAVKDDEQFWASDQKETRRAASRRSMRKIYARRKLEKERKLNEL
jgi:hypothetical protein